MKLKPLRGRLIAQLIPPGGKRASGLIVVTKAITTKAEVLAIGESSMSVKGKVLKSPAMRGDIIHFKKYTPMSHKDPKRGLITIWWEDILLVESEDNA